MSAETPQIGRRLELPGAEVIFGRTAGMRDVRRKIERAIADDLPVLLEGESGTGKEVIGRFLHAHSVRKEGPFVKVNCGAMPARLLEAEMFGYEKGAAGDGKDTRNGSIGMAAGGTLFLDEIGDMDVTLQKKLVRTLEIGHYGRQGSSEEIALAARFICATSIDLKSGERRATVLEEFLGTPAYHRARLLPLRKRKEDIPQLCEHLLEKFARNFGRSVPRLSSFVLDAFQQWDWPGNIRELENWIARIVIFGTEEAIELEFSRQLAAWVAPVQRRHRATTLGRTRRVRRHV